MKRWRNSSLNISLPPKVPDFPLDAAGGAQLRRAAVAAVLTGPDRENLWTHRVEDFLNRSNQGNKGGSRSGSRPLYSANLPPRQDLTTKLSAHLELRAIEIVRSKVPWTFDTAWKAILHCRLADHVASTCFRASSVERPKPNGVSGDTAETDLFSPLFPSVSGA